MKKRHGSIPLAAKRSRSKGAVQPSRTPSPPGPRDLAAIFADCGLSPTAHQIDQLWTYHGLLRRYNSELNLTRIHNFSNMVLKLYVDSVLPATLTHLPSPFMDLGTGPGMPGIPLKIFQPDMELWLAEGRGKRVAFLQEVVKTLDLATVRIIDRNITPQFAQCVAGVITRAVETMDQTLGRVAGCLVQEGRVIFMKGPGCDEEVAEATERFKDQYQLVENTPYRIAKTSHERRLVVFQRLDEPPVVKARKAAGRHRVTAVTGEQNHRFKALKKLLTGRGLKKTDQALMSGVRSVADMIARNPDQGRAWITNGDGPPPPEHTPAEMEWIQMAPPLFQILDLFGTRAPLLLMDRVPITPWTPGEGFPEGCTLLVPFQDPENVGAVIRSAVAFGVSQIILLAESAHPYHPKALRAAAGAQDMVPLRLGPALDELPGDLPIVALSAEGHDLDHLPFPSAFGLLVGMEGPGLPAKWRNRSARIPIQNGVESLNGATAVAIALYQWSRRR